MTRNRTMLKVALLSTCLIWASINAITANIPEMAKSFPGVELYVIELIATVPSLFQMLAVLFSGLVSKFLGLKRTTMLGLLLCGVSGIVPVFIQDFYVLFLSRCVFGIGCGLIVSSALTLIIGFFDGSERSTMIGLQGSVGGLGSAVSALVAGQLLAFGWNWSFAVYAFSFVVLVLFAAVVPNTTAQDDSANDEGDKSDGATIAGLVFQGALMFLSILIITLFVVKASTFITDRGLGTAQQGSFAITLISLGSLVAGALYGRNRSVVKDYALVAFMAIGASGFVVAAMSSSLAGIMVAAFLIGYAMMAIVPHLQENVSLRFGSFGTKGTNLILVTQALGAFAAPYLGSALGLFSSDVTTQFLMCAAGLGLLAIVSGVYAKTVR